jgi:GNAT superfamily N-acetyltransferase
MTPTVRPAVSEDLDTLLELMANFYDESNYDLDRGLSRRALWCLIGNPSLGAVWLIEHDGLPVGYIVLAVCFSMEQGGLRAYVDDLFVRAEFRGRGFGSLSMETLFAECRQRNVRSIHVEVGRRNNRAKKFYGRFGFRENDRQLLTCNLTNDTTAIARRNGPS